MTATVTDLKQWKESHPPALRCLAAMQRCWWSWATLTVYPWWLPRR